MSLGGVVLDPGHIGAARAFLDLGYSLEQVKLAFLNRGMSEHTADSLVKEAAPLGAIMGGIKMLGGLFGRAAVKGAPAVGRQAAEWGAKNVKNLSGITQIAKPGMQAGKGILTGGNYGAQTGSLTGKLMQGGQASQFAGNALHQVGAAAQHGLAGFQGSPWQMAKHVGGGILNAGKGMFFMGSKNPSLANMAGKGYGAYGMGSMLLGPGSTPMPTPQMQRGY